MCSRTTASRRARRSRSGPAGTRPHTTVGRPLPARHGARRSGGLQAEAAGAAEEPDQAVAAVRRALAGPHAGIVERAGEPLLPVALHEEGLVAPNPARSRLPLRVVRAPEDLVVVAQLDHVHAAERVAGLRLVS